jgi:hypothetical protein
MSAVTSVIGHRWPDKIGGIEKWRGWVIPDQDFKTYLCPTFDPAFVANAEQEVVTIWEGDFAKIFEEAERLFPPYAQDGGVGIFDGVSASDKVYDWLSAVQNVSQERSISDPFWLSLDIETTGLKPHNQDAHHIVVMSLCRHFAGAKGDCEAISFAWPLQGRTPSERKRTKRMLRRVLMSQKVGKIAHNMKFEHAWLKACLGVEVKNWHFDTMLATHILDNRPGIMSLKFQTYVNFGVIDYASKITPFLQSDGKKNGNAVNRIDSLLTSREGRKKLLEYCGKDAWFTYKLAQKQLHSGRFHRDAF